MGKQITRRQVDLAGAEYSHDSSTWGENNMITIRSFMRYVDLQTAFDNQEKVKAAKENREPRLYGSFKR